ncbi:TRAP transporter small permease [Planococcus beigongshangi]|uniref:TRAP transporter small permease n=1 Tax=Planococcus beigongshangi TaxID=2782536 RepID=UPI00193B7528|nr:TRAP transporter small permease [Planococcus beigongshangi]
MKWLKKLDDHFEESVTFILFAILIIVVFLQVIFRYIFQFSLHWGEETARYTFIVLVYFSAIVAVKRSKHLRTEGFVEMLPYKVKKWVKILSDVIWLAFTLLMVRLSFISTMTVLASGQQSPVLGFTMGYVYGVIPICFTLMSFRIIQKIIQKIKNQKNDEDTSSAETLI